VVPDEHVENIYELVPELAVHVHEAARQVALALKQVYRCDGITTWKHNEPAGRQPVILALSLARLATLRCRRLYELSQQHRYTEPEERKPYAERLRAYFARGGAGCTAVACRSVVPVSASAPR
jgi:histidine triad (HIT) family protein